MSAKRVTLKAVTKTKCKPVPQERPSALKLIDLFLESKLAGSHIDGPPPQRHSRQQGNLGTATGFLGASRPNEITSERFRAIQSDSERLRDPQDDHTGSQNILL